MIRRPFQTAWLWASLLCPAVSLAVDDGPVAAPKALPEDDRGSSGETAGHSSTASNGSTTYRSDWQGSRRWIGPDWWANPLTDWKLAEDEVVASAAADRTLCLLPAWLGGQGSKFEVRVVVSPLARNGNRTVEVTNSAAGFRIGRRGRIDDHRHTLVHATEWTDAAIRGDGRLALGDSLSHDRLSLDQGSVALTLKGYLDADQMTLRLSASRGPDSIFIEKSVTPEKVFGGIALLCDGPSMPGGSDARQQYAFGDFEFRGDLVQPHLERSFGPIAWSQYTLSHGQLRLQAQFCPIDSRQDSHAELWVAETETGASWARVATAPVESLSRTATFTVDPWPQEKAMRYQVRFTWRGALHVWEGVVRREPGDRKPLKLACFSCDNGYLFPIPPMVDQVSRQNPDMLFFAGDQIYESYGGFGVARTAGTELAMLDYLRKYYQFGWTWRDLMRDRPTIILPDDHDVFQGNLWGHGGRSLPPSSKKNDWTLGGYLMPGDWVEAVERTQVGHLPDPAVAMRLPIGIRPYFTSMTYGGVGFAILEDRKFKTGPSSIPRDRRDEASEAELLGEEQEAFLERWAGNWQGQQMKCALSQTIFCNAATHAGSELRRARGYFDSGAWPKPARNRVVRILGDSNALSIHGDQHLGVLLRQGVDDFDDAGFAFMVPGTANGFPRAWWPGVGNTLPQPRQDFTGKFHDDAGHPINVLAVGNPEPGSNALPKTVDPMTIGYRKGSGYGIVEFDIQTKTAKISLYRLGDRGEQFRGFPQTIRVGGQPD